MLVLSVIDAAKSVVGAAGDKDKRKASSAAGSSSASAAGSRAPPSDGESDSGLGGGTPETPAARGETAEAPGGDGSGELEAPSHGAERSLWGRRRVGVRRDTPGWRAWEAR